MLPCNNPSAAVALRASALSAAILAADSAPSAAVALKVSALSAAILAADSAASAAVALRASAASAADKFDKSLFNSGMSPFTIPIGAIIDGDVRIKSDCLFKTIFVLAMFFKNLS